MKNRIKRFLSVFIAVSILFTYLSCFAEPSSNRFGDLICNKTEHIHSEECCEIMLDCDQEETEKQKEFIGKYIVHKHTDECLNSKGEIACGIIEGIYYHKHNEYCRNDEGEIVCGLISRSPHTHTDDCYTTESTLTCEKEETEGHTHSESCYSKSQELICDQEEAEGHTHSDSCYTEEKELVCEKEENENHTHTDECYITHKTLICELDESEGHTHNDNCYSEIIELICDQEETEGHAHSASCYTETKKLVCDIPTTTHIHTDSCYNGNKFPQCGKEEIQTFTCTADDWKETEGHVHTEECYIKKMVCEKEEHTHTEECYAPIDQQTTEENNNINDVDNIAAQEEQNTNNNTPDPTDENNNDNDVNEEPVNTADNETFEEETNNILNDNEEQSTSDIQEDPENDTTSEIIQEDNQPSQEDPTEYEKNEDASSEQDKTEDLDLLEDANTIDNDQITQDTYDDNPATNTNMPDESSQLPVNEDQNAEIQDNSIDAQQDVPVLEENAGNEATPTDLTPQEDETEPSDDKKENNLDDPDDKNKQETVIIPTQDDSDYKAFIRFSTTNEIPKGTILLVKEQTDTDTTPIRKSSTKSSPQKASKAEGTDITDVQITVPSLKSITSNSDEQIYIYKKTLDISLINNDEEIEPLGDTPVHVKIQLPDVREDMDVEVWHIKDDKRIQLECVNNNGYIAFDTDSFSVFEFVVPAKEVSSWSTEQSEYTAWGMSEPEEGQHREIEINDVITGLTVLEAYHVDPSQNMWISVRETPVEASSQYSSLLLCSVEDNELKGVVRKNITADETLCFNTADLQDFAIVMDSGYRDKELVSDNIYIAGMLPKNSEAVSEEITSEYTIQNFTDLEEIGINNEEQEETVNASVLAVYDIGIYAEGDVYEPDEEHPVTVTIENPDITENKVLWVCHIKDDNSKELVEEINIENGKISFVSKGFSAYAIIEGPSDVSIDCHPVETYEMINEHASTGMYIGHWDYYFMTNIQLSKVGGTNGRTGIQKTKPSNPNPVSAGASKYYLDIVDNDNHYYKFYCYGPENQKQYVRWVTGNDATKKSLSFTTEADATTFIVEPFSETITNAFKIHAIGSEYYWNMQGNASGTAIAAFNNANDANAKLRFVYRDEYTSDPYDLTGKSYGLMSWNGSVTGHAMMAEETESSSLEAKSLTVLAQKDNYQDKLFVPNESDITYWTFTWINDTNYYVTTTVNGQTKYLKITSEGISLVDESSASPVVVKAGSGTYAGMIYLSNGTVPITYHDSETGFAIGGTVGKEWLYLVNESELTADYYMTYSARKVSISDDDITNGSRIVIYTRTWNYTTDRYEFYTIDHDGSLIRCFESGDSIQWIGNRINSLLWNFVEYYWEGTDDPNFYYDLYNQYSEKFISPQNGTGQILSNNPVGVNLNGRQKGTYFSSILAWDENTQSYSGLKVEEDNNGNKYIVACDKDESDDFYIAIMQDIQIDDETTTVPTVDNTLYGIKMKMKDFDSRATMSNFLGNNTGGSGSTLQQGLLSTNLGADDYPTAAGGSLGTLFSGAEDVNHLFIQSTYSGTGYYEFDSTQNYATLKGRTGGDFVVYKEIGTHDESSLPTRKHGQFFPYNDLKPGVFSSLNPRNLYDANGNELPDSNPRKNEPLYLIQPNPGEGHADFYFGMEIEASFVQTPSGYDAWGHDIIYEFTGDDDFWLYVDGELVIDLGGIHSAVPGTVNYHTGKVVVNNGPVQNLRDIFYNNYKGRGHTDAEALAYVDNLFETKTDINGETYYTFKDYTTHTMRIFYMERGAGGSNLHMRFNLASVKEGHVELSKTISGVDETESLMAEFPYQIWYVLPSDVNDSNSIVTEHLLYPDNENGISVNYKDTNTPVTYSPTFTLNGKDSNGTPYTMSFNHVFLLKPGETADIDLPDQTILYKIVECGVNTTVYSSVTVNEGDETVTETTVAGYPDNRRDYYVDFSSAKDRARVAYLNTVNPEALRTLSIKKILYDEVGSAEVHDDYGTFEFRLYLDSEYSPELNLANMYKYHVRDENGNYCYWDTETKRFTSLGDNKNDYSALTSEEKKAAGILTSIYGTISNIPSFYTVEIREILVGTKYKVEERDNSVPKGYSRQKYIYYEDDEDVSGTDSLVPITDLIESGKDPLIKVCNLKGYGIAVNKVWSDDDYVAYRDPSYFALYYEDNGSMVLAEDVVDYPVIKLAQNETDLYWYIEKLKASTMFSQYTVYEVYLENPVIDADGNVTGYDSITRINQDETILIDGRLKGDTQILPCEYKVEYSDPIPDPRNANVKSYTITNKRSGITLIKGDMEGNKLQGSEFVLSDDDDNMHSVYTSDSDGVITTAFLREGIEYTLEETKAPYTYRGYFGLQSPMKIKLVNGSITVTDGDPLYYDISDDGQTLTIKNRVYYFQVIKQDKDTELPLANAHFKLHKQVTVGGYTGFDFNPMTGYEDLVSGSTGIVPLLDNTLKPGTYELREISSPTGYAPLESNIQFTISPVGIITMGNRHPQDVTLDSEIQNDTSVLYTMTIPNQSTESMSTLTISKTVTGSMSDRSKNFVFTLNGVEDEDQGSTYAYVKTKANAETEEGSISSGNTFTLAHGEQIVITFPKNKEIRITEDKENYASSWIQDEKNEVTSNIITVNLDENSSVVVTNALNPVAPTSVRIEFTHALIILLSCIFLIIVQIKRNND